MWTVLVSLLLLVHLVVTSESYLCKKLGRSDLKVRGNRGLLLRSYEDGLQDGLWEAVGQQSSWYDMEGCSVLLPSGGQVVPRAIVHFLGGFVAGSAAPLAYGRTLSSLADAGYLVVVSPIPALQTNHSNIASSVAQTFTRCYENQLLRLMGSREEAIKVPIVGLSHSLVERFRLSWPLVNRIGGKYRPESEIYF
jgi:hypothetical protein